MNLGQSRFCLCFQLLFFIPLSLWGSKWDEDWKFHCFFQTWCKGISREPSLVSHWLLQVRRATVFPLPSEPCWECKVQKGDGSATASPCQAGEVVRLQSPFKSAIPVRLLRSIGCEEDVWIGNRFINQLLVWNPRWWGLGKWRLFRVVLKHSMITWHK